MDELELKERAGKFVYQLYSNNRKTLIELFEAAFTRMDDYKARAERAEAEAQSAILAASDAERALANCRALLDALPALPIRIEARCCHCDKPATIARTYYDSGFPSAREHLCPEHADNHPWHGTAIPPVARPKPGIGWNDTAPGDGGEEAG